MSKRILMGWSCGCCLGAALLASEAWAQGRIDGVDDSRAERRGGFYDERQDRAERQQGQAPEETSANRQQGSRDEQRSELRDEQRTNSRRRGQNAEREAGLGVALSPGEEVFIEEVMPDSPAERAGLQPGDEILSVDGRQVGTAWELVEEIRGKEPGGRVELEIRRDGRRRQVETRLASREQALAETDSQDSWDDRASERTSDQDRQSRQGPARGADSRQDLARQIQRLQQRLDRLERELQDMRGEHRRLISRRPDGDARFDGDTWSQQEDRSDMQDFDDDWAEEEMRGDKPHQPPEEEEFGPEEN